MPSAPLPPDEQERLDELHRFEILDTLAESEYDDLVFLASKICGTPIALVSLVDENRQYFKARVGLAASETPRDVAFCAHAILKPELMVVNDAAADERFADNPLVKSDPNIRFYAGTPLITPAGHAMGTLCVIDRVPRTLDDGQREALRALGRQVEALLSLRRAKAEAERLLMSLFPKPVADRLRADPQATIVEEYPEASIMLCSVDDFWEVVGGRPPSEIIELLNEVFSLFDRLAEQAGVQKIKTISNAYLAACGLPEPRADHAEAVADLALAMQREIATIATGSRKPFSVRIGVHSGATIAGVVGIHKLAYDLWGPAVDTACQMEALGVPGGIQVSEASHALLEDNYLFEPRGEFYVRGQGEVTTYLLRGRRAG
ncbi:adenylate/guanylate cyclase domain-containing protein [Piscinibacter sakaiensis]|uniref:adenylate/guanylate cyclase domain-containing protein n=1 Tax=Piscinibacter sakaiensis TaxID=1547922 RepID=UPI003AACA723